MIKCFEKINIFAEEKGTKIIFIGFIIQFILFMTTLIITGSLGKLQKLSNLKI